MKRILTEKAPAPIGPYSQAVQIGDTLYSSGQLGMEPATGELAEGIGAQTEQAIKNIAGILEEAGMGFGNVVKTLCFLSSMDDFAEFNGIYERYFVSKPARSCVEVSRLPKDGLVEIEVIAVVVER